MANPARKSFEIKTAQQYFEELLRPAHAEFLQDALSSRKAIACAIFAWHLRDWIWAGHKNQLRSAHQLKELRQFDRHLFAKCPELELIQEIATGSKHFEGDGTAITESGLVHGFAGLPLIFTQSHLVVNAGGTVHFAGNLLTRAVSYWEEFLKGFPSP